jgi:hypothetical protein
MLIGLTGYKESGKSTAAQALVDRGFIRMRMAGALKEMLRCIGLGEEEIEGELKQVPCEMLGGQTPRFAMQTLGTEWGRQLITEDLWIRVMQRKLRSARGTNIVIDDIRFPNEAEMLKEFDGVLWKIVRPDTSGDSHASEKWIASLPVDRTFYNAGTIDELRAVIGAAVFRRNYDQVAGVAKLHG